jgi:hypothetical protein
MKILAANKRKPDTAGKVAIISPELRAGELGRL